MRGIRFYFGDLYQVWLILLGLLCSIFFGFFFYREVFPEYRIYQEDYGELEDFRSSYTGQPPPQFKNGVKQIVLEREDKGPPLIDRCISCHVALEIPDFSPTMISKDINGNIVFDKEGIPIQVENPNYVWKKLDEANPSQAERYADLKLAQVGDHTYDVTKVLRMHPLMGRETRPFEFHPMEEYGCTVCHNGNGRGLTTEKAHGPVFDGDYEKEFLGPTPQFLECDPQHDPSFSKVFNGKPAESLVFQTTPIYVGSLIEAKCIECHQTSMKALQGISTSASLVIGQREKELKAAEKGYETEKKSVLSLLALREAIQKEGLEATIQEWVRRSSDYSLPAEEQEYVAAQLKFLKNNQDPQKAIEIQLEESIGTPELVEKLVKNPDLDVFIAKKENNPEAKGSLFVKFYTLNIGKQILRHVQEVETSLSSTVGDQANISQITTDVDRLTQHFHHGEQLFISQACYGCHRIAGYSRGGVGPELTRSGNSYPWYVKESIVWPQADLKTSTMPNSRLDHEELEDLVTFLLAQKGISRAISETNYHASLAAWEAGKKMSWEKPIPPSQIEDLSYSMTVFATEGCASCHRLKGFESNVGFAIEKENPSYNAIYEEKAWFTKLFPEDILGSQIVATIEKHQEELDQRIVDNVRQGSILEEIELKYPKTIESFYSPFKFALRAHEEQDWKEKVRKVLMIYVQEYGLGRLIGPRPSYSGVMRTDEWLMEHFRNPTSHVPRSIMPIMPFDDTKFYSLTYMLDVLGQRNRKELREIWTNRGFTPESVVTLLCSQCHGEFLQGNGPVATWIYPIPKNLRRADFLRNLTKQRVMESIAHGVKGTPMLPWGELGKDKPFSNDSPVLTEKEIKILADWIFANLSGGQVYQEQEVPKWEYSCEDVIKDLKNEGIEIPEEEVNAIFDRVPHPIAGSDPNAYYIKKSYYTPQNLAVGEAFFLENCAVCHGKEGDGTGARGVNMTEAKPRMLTNLDWLKTRDDLRLLRSIKYGVSGTAMTPWGDFTSALQRMQLVMFIRSLSEEAEKREDMLMAIYKAFDSEKFIIEKERGQEYQNIAKIEEEYNKAKKEQQELLDKLKNGQADTDEVITAYQQMLYLQKQLENAKKKDVFFAQLLELLKKEKEIYTNLGLSLLSSELNEEAYQLYMKILANEQNRSNQDPEREKMRSQLEKKLLEYVSQAIAKEQKIEESLKKLEKYQKELMTGLGEARRLRLQQTHLLNQK